ncbi:hypothetical protein HK097_003170 [Rhizophlyctis rosea]|uniref:HNH nuclease domain-containing protein n=1 Tax=Rhizophlyctis rosea TaxID=64517 RepID=A0AAD5SF20_9FUNG|nr:hypothetical protein HK097_003170 [Rhizophlyctis rosea]
MSYNHINIWRRPPDERKLGSHICRIPCPAAGRHGGCHRADAFAQRLYMRDSFCAVTGEYRDGQTEAARILAHAWFNPMRMPRLPPEIYTFISDLEGGADDIRNGIILAKPLAKAIDDGHIAFRIVDGDIILFALHADFISQYDGKKVMRNDRVRGDGRKWSEFLPPAELLHFHFFLAVTNNLRGGGAKRDEDKDEDRGLGSLKARIAGELGGGAVAVQIASRVGVDVMDEARERVASAAI